MHYLTHQLPVIFVLLPLVCAVVIILSQNLALTRFLLIGCNVALLLTAFVTLLHPDHLPYRYVFGGWLNHVGIEFKLGALGLLGVFLLYLIASIYLILLYKPLVSFVDSNIAPRGKVKPFYI